MNALAPEPVQNVEAEQELLGAVFLHNDVFWRMAEFLAPEDFFEPTHAKIFEVIGKLLRAGKTATPITVKPSLPADFLPGMTMQQYLSKLTADATSIINAMDYARIVRDMSVRRGLIALSQEVAERARHAEPDETPVALIEDAERGLYELADRGNTRKGFRSFGVPLVGAIDTVAAAYKRDGALSGIATGFTDLDRLTGGLHHSDLIIIAGRPGMGKSALATNIAYHAARHFATAEKPEDRAVNGARVGFFSLEMSAEQLALRILSERSEISSSLLRTGAIRETDFTRLVDVSNEMSSIPLYIDDSGGLSISQLTASARRLKRRQAIDLLIVDYLQLLSAPGRRGDGRVQEITEITTSLKALAKELDVPVIALSQLSRQVETRDDKRPLLSDLRESGSIEQDADLVMFVYREEYYLKNKEPEEGTTDHVKWSEKMQQVANEAEVIIGKHRHGPTGTVRLHFDSRFTRFSDRDWRGYGAQP